MELLTAGHGSLAVEDLCALLREAGVELVVDVRIRPASRRNPQFNRLELEEQLFDHGIAYRWDRRMGGFREPPEDSPDGGLQEPALRGYAAHMRGAEFAEAMDALLADAQARRTSVMCAESSWESCHRRLIADHAQLVRGACVVHLSHDGSLEPHEPDPAARLERGALVYDGGQEALF